jgi:hypothetical protein
LAVLVTSEDRMAKVRVELAAWFTVLARYVGMTGLIFEVTTHHEDPFVIGILAVMMGFGHIVPSRTERVQIEEIEE